jgi:predicted DsbA family dithiol-disulfide isomerase
VGTLFAKYKFASVSLSSCSLDSIPSNDALELTSSSIVHTFREGEDIKEHIGKKYGAGMAAKLDSPDNSIAVAGRAVGIQFTNKRNMYPTVQAHALMEHVKRSDNAKANALMEVMYSEYFEKGININNVDVLTALAERVGIDKVEAKAAIENQDLQALVRQKDQAYKTEMRVSGVPFFIIEPNNGGRPIAFSGAQPADIIAEQLEKANEE